MCSEMRMLGQMACVNRQPEIQGFFFFSSEMPAIQLFVLNAIPSRAGKFRKLQHSCFTNNPCYA